jgi:hypothetical protein
MMSAESRKWAKEMRRRTTNFFQSQRRSFAIGAVVGGANAAPTKGDTPWATGRARESLTSSNAVPGDYDPGPNKSRYKKPNERDAVAGIRGGKHTDVVVVSMGVPYGFALEIHHKVITEATSGGVGALITDHAKHAEKLSYGRR